MVRPATSKVLPPFRAQSLYTLGYQLRSLDDFLEALRAADIDVVVDVRQTAFSRKPGFSKGRLADALASHEIEYVHADFAGNPKEIRRDADSHGEILANFSAYLGENPSVLANLARMVRGVGNRRRICFICYERHPNDCHRHILVEHWRQHAGVDFNVTHLDPEGAPRLARA